MERHPTRNSHESVRGETLAGARGDRQRAAFTWLDPETGETLQVELSAHGDYLDRLEASGFVRVERVTSAATPRGRNGGNVVRVVVPGSSDPGPVDPAPPAGGPRDAA